MKIIGNRMTSFTSLFKKRIFIHALLLLSGCIQASTASAQTTPSYNHENAPTFSFSLDQFFDEFNSAYAAFALPVYNEVEHKTRYQQRYFASKINQTLYSSIVTNSQNDQIKSVQITYRANDPNLPFIVGNLSPENSHNVSFDNTIAIDYMSALFCWFHHDLTYIACQNEVFRLLTTGSNQPFYEELTDNLRYVVADHGEKGITLALEPIKHVTK